MMGCVFLMTSRFLTGFAGFPSCICITPLGFRPGFGAGVRGEC
jgi:hypothetical protein